MRSLVFDSAAFEDLAWWIETDRRQALRIVKLVRAIQSHPFEGVGKPEPLRHELSGCWSRRIDSEHRVVYEVTDAAIRILSLRYHYYVVSHATGSFQPQWKVQDQAVLAVGRDFVPRVR